MKRWWFVVLGFLILIVALTLIVNAKTSIVNLQDWVKVEIVSPLESNGAVPINIQDQHSPAFDIYFAQIIANITLQANATASEYTINLTPGHGVNVGDQIDLFDNVTQRGFVGQAVAVNGNIVTVDRPLSNSLPYLTTMGGRYTINLSVDGSITPQIFSVSPPLDVEIDITRVMFQMITNTAPDFGKFGDIGGGLTNGVVLRIVNGRTNNLFNVKTNGELVNLMYDVTFYDASNPGQGVYGLGGRLTYAGPNKHGVTLRLAQGEELQVIIQDDLTSLNQYRMIAAGHVVTD
jgi:hypothetical protein